MAVGAAAAAGRFVYTRHSSLAVKRRHDLLVEADKTEQLRQRTAQITAGPHPSRRDESGTRYYCATLTNMGPAHAVHVKAWLEDPEGVRVIGELYGRHLKADETMVVELPLADEYWSHPPPLTLMVEQWTEKNGMVALPSHHPVVLK